MLPFLSGVAQNGHLACVVGRGAMTTTSRRFSFSYCIHSFPFSSRHPVCGGSRLPLLAIHHLRSFSTSLVAHKEEKAPFSSPDDSHGLTFLEELDHIIASSSSSPSLATIPAFDSSSSSCDRHEKDRSECGTVSGGASAPSIALLKQWSNEVYRQYGRRPRLLLSFFQANPGNGKNGSDLGPFLADVGFDVDISPAGQWSPSTIARLAVEADVHGVLLLHPSYGKTTTTADDHPQRPAKDAADAAPLSNGKPTEEAPSTAPFKSAEEDLMLLRKELRKMNAEDISLFYVGGDVNSSRSGTKGRKEDPPCANETLQSGASPVWKNEVWHFSGVSSPTMIASSILKFFLEKKEEE